MLARIANKAIALYGFPREYVCCAPNALEGLTEWVLDERPIAAEQLVLLGYRPLVLATDPSVEDRPHRIEVRIAGRPVARLRIRPFTEQHRYGPGLFIGEGPWQRFLPLPLHLVDRGRQWANSRRPGNITTNTREYDLLRIGYARPREVHLAVVGGPADCNVFPTDLHGDLGGNGYRISLRSAGMACSQVQERGTFILCRIPLDQAGLAYTLGPRHMAEPAPMTEILPWQGEHAGHGLPMGTLSVIHCSVKGHVDIGAHRIFHCDTSERRTLAEGIPLAQVHVAILAALRRAGIRIPVVLP
ncbi:MAG: hypothetical protein H6597_01940 [Flavobacteriales bacterium]|nr:hypothetical protein [Flavobacteriales bacterium]